MIYLAKIELACFFRIPRVYLNKILYVAAKIKNIILKSFNTLQQTVFDVLLFKFKNL